MTDHAPAATGSRRLLLTIPRRLLLGFGVVLALLAANVGNGMIGIRKVDENFQDYAIIAEAARRVADVERAVLPIGPNASYFTATGTESAKSAAKAYLAMAADRLKSVREVVTQPDRIALLDQISTLLGRYSARFEQALSLRTIRDQTIDEQLIGAENAARRAVNALVTSAAASGDQAAFGRAQAVQEQFNDAVPDVIRFLGDPNQMSAATAMRAISDTVGLARGQDKEGPVTQAVADYQAIIGQIADISLKMDDLVSVEMPDIARAMSEQAAGLRARQQQDLEMLGAEVVRRNADTTHLAMLLGTLALVVGLFLAYSIGRGIARPILSLTTAMRRLANGDSSIEVPGAERSDEVGEMARAVEVFRETAIASDALARDVTDSVRQVAIAAVQATQAISQVSNGSQSQMLSLRTVLTALEQSADAIRDVAASTVQASQQAESAADAVRQGMDNVQGLATFVETIADNNQQVGRITDQIGHIANQTNILALNAAIEAARAGEHGLGFAVVAEEVRKLAETSGESAADIASLARSATQQVANGVRTMGEASGAMGTVSDSVRETHRLANSIATAMEEQQATVHEIEERLRELVRIGQSNATAAEEIDMTMRELADLAEATRQKVAAFNAARQRAPAEE